MEPRWLIGEPASDDQAGQQAEQAKVDQEAEIIEPVIQGTYKGKTAAQWREEAQACTRRSGESFDRCDTDGFLSQWADDTTARRYEMYARLAEKDGIWEFPALFNLVGGLVPDAVWIKTKLNKWVWRIGSGEAVAWFDPSRARSGARRRANDAAKGYQVGTIRARAYVASSGSGRGLSGVMSVGFYIGRDEDSPIEIVDNGTLGTRYTDW